ncbi:substrate-binding periplasmic protein [Colwellia sp. MEBiC06753]
MKYLLILIVFLFSINAIQAKSLEVIASHFPFIAEQTENGEFAGLGIELINKIANQLNIELEIKIYPLARALKMMESGQADMFIGPYKSADREKYMLYSQDPFYQDTIVFYKKLGANVVWQGQASQLTGKRIGVIRGWSYGPLLNNNTQLDITKAHNVEACFKMLIKDRIDLCATHPRAAFNTIKQLAIKDKVAPLEPPIIVNLGYFAFAIGKQSAEFKNTFNQVLHKLIVNGELQALNNKYQLDGIDYQAIAHK